MKKTLFLFLASACLFSHAALTQKGHSEEGLTVPFEQADAPPGAVSGSVAGDAVQRDSVGISQAKSIREFIGHDGRIDLEVVRRSGYQGALDLDGFQPSIDPVTGQPVLRPSTTTETAADPDDIYWDNSISPSLPGVDGAVYALTFYNGKLYAGGGFTTAGGVAATSIAAWDRSSWAAMGQGVVPSLP